MFIKTVYRVVSASQTLSAMKERHAQLSASRRETALAALVQAYDSAELAAFCCPLLWAERASGSGGGLVRETILLPIDGLTPEEVQEVEGSWTDSDDELQWEQMRKQVLAHGGYLLATPSAHVPGQRMVLINMAHKAFAHAVIRTRRLHDREGGYEVATPAAPMHAETSQLI